MSLPLSEDSIRLIPPQNIEAEQSLLGALLIDKDALTRVADLLLPEDFYRDVHRFIYDAMIDLYEKHEPIDVLSLANRLEEKNHLAMIGGRSYLLELAGSVPTASHVVHYASIIQKKSMLRKLQGASADIGELVHQPDDDIDTILDTAEKKVFAISQRMLKRSFIPLKDALADAFERIDELHRERGKLRGTPTGFADLDSILAGLQRSDLIIIAARPSVGKTSLALDIARNVSTRGSATVAIFSLEMSKEQLVDRLICAQAGVDLWRMRTGKLSDRSDSDDFVRIGHAISALSEARFFIDDTASASIMEMRTKARRLASEHGLDVIIVDYLQLMESSARKEGRVQEIAEITRGLKAIARELNIPVIALSQLARAVEMNKPALPKLSHLRDSGTIEQDADIVLFIYRKAADRNYRYDELTDDEKTLAEIIIAKHRNGPTGTLKLFWDERRVSFRDMDRTHDPATIFQTPF